ncbi:hypothetical protein JAAARDRAFT_205876 [Jaapia argillacea MUCL 33604]|uniref:Uncharacterized protein n=1 Tax=Jaapia argillacea MUCL 33604 TaxID=933084 RepID=A0A067QBK2_9AGAM|nr:hypothetical protein JAAARDRAFT_205876 [Jaapia argillacea MUCL 33604]
MKSPLATGDLPPRYHICTTHASHHVALVAAPQTLYCGTPGVQVVPWVYRRRACKACLDQHFTDFRSLTLPTLPCRVEWDEILPKVRRERYCRPNLCPNDEVDLVFQHIEALRDDEDGLAWFILQRTTFMTEVSLHASRCERYQTDLAAQRIQERSEMRSRRVDVIRNRLVDMGFEHDIIALEQSNPRVLRRHHLVWQIKELTDKNWNDIKPSLVAWLTDLRKPRIQKERLARMIRRQATIVQMLRDYVLSRPPTEIIPGPADLCFTEEISGLINHPDETVFSNSIPALRLRLPQFASHWRQWIDRRLLSFLPSATKSGTDATDVHPLYLATTFFECTGPTGCHEILPYPRILAHKCMTQQSGEYFDTDGGPISESIQSLGCEPFNFDGNKIKFHADASGAANTLVGLCELDPDEMTAVAMDGLNARFACSACSSGEEEAFVFSWRVAVHHAVTAHGRDKSTTWIRLTESEATAAMDVEMIWLEIYTNSWIQNSNCTLCRQRIGGGEELIIHWNLTHEGPVHDGSVHLHPGAPTDVIPFPVTIYLPRLAESKDGILTSQSPS